MNRHFFLLLLTAGFLLCTQCKPGRQQTSTATALPSWKEGAAKKAILDFVYKTTRKGSKDFIPVADRIACFDNDGTLWSEQPMYFQFAFVLDRVKVLAPQHPEWTDKQPFKGVLEGDLKTALAGGEKALYEMLLATQSGDSGELEKAVKEWMATAKHPRFHRAYTDLVFQPMLELLAFLRANGYKTYIVSGGSVEFMRPWTESVYGIPPEQVVGTTLKEKYELRDGVPAIVRLPEINFIDDKAGKPVCINQFIGRRPVFTAGNSDGDYEMLQWTSTATGYPRFGMIVHHTDAEREWAYDRESHVGQLGKGLDDAAKYGWYIVDMKNDWKRVYSFQ